MTKKINKRPVDFLIDDVGPWWRKTFEYTNKKEVETWKGSLVLMFVAGFFIALIWSAKTDYHTSSLAAPNSAVYFTPASTTVPSGSDFSLNAIVNPGTNGVTSADLRVTFDPARLSLVSVTKSSEPANEQGCRDNPVFSTTLRYANIDNVSGTASIALGVCTVRDPIAPVVIPTTIATFNFRALTVGTNSVVNFTTSTEVAAVGELGNVVTTRTGSLVTVVPSDGTPPSGGLINYANGYAAETPVVLTVADGTDASGINTSSRIVQRRSATLSNNTCGTYGSWVAITPSGTHPNFTDSSVVTGNCYQYQYLVSDTVVPANQTTYTSLNVVKIDTGVPTGGTITYANNYLTTASVVVTVSDGTDAVSGINNSSRIVQRRSAALLGGNCGTYGSFVSITPTGTYPNLVDSTVSNGNCYQYQYQVSDNAGRQATYTGANTAKVDTAVPANGSITYTDGYYTTASVSITANDGTDAVSGINTASRILNRRSAILSGGACGTYGSWASIIVGTYPNFVDNTVSNGNCYQYQYQVSDNAGSQATITSSYVAKIDAVTPSGGSLTYSDGYNSNHSITITVSDGTDAVSGINASSRTVQRRSATLANDTCGTYGSWGNIIPTGAYPNFTDTTVAAENCYQYQYLVSDNAGRQVAYPSSNSVKVSYLADMNLDGEVSIYDYNLLFQYFGNTDCNNPANVVGTIANCEVDIYDYNQLFTDFGKSVK